MKNFSLFVVTVLIGSWVSAQTPQTAAPPSVDGETIAQKGNNNGAAACLACHGAQGEGKSEGGFPRLAGLPMDYMVKQLADYASDARVNPVMGPIAKALNAAEREKVSEYYSGLAVPVLKPKQKISAALVKRGEKLAEIGDQKMQLQACNNCHGPGGRGVAPLIPGLASQHGSYLEAQIRAWKAGQRKNSPNQMVQIAQKLDDASLKALAAYFEQVKVK